jgi:hypothetical protein
VGDQGKRRLRGGQSTVPKSTGRDHVPSRRLQGA